MEYLNEPLANLGELLNIEEMFEVSTTPPDNGKSLGCCPVINGMSQGCCPQK